MCWKLFVLRSRELSDWSCRYIEVARHPSTGKLELYAKVATWISTRTAAIDKAYNIIVRLWIFWHRIGDSHVEWLVMDKHYPG